MFTGIVQDVGRIARLEPRGGDVRLVIEVDRLSLAAVQPGDSISVSGVCLTALDLTPRSFAADVSRETLDVTTLGSLAEGSRVNLEPALRAGDALGGHLVSGHVDGIAAVV
ncbi:MAG: riboflavin synthase, partial [Steroidobacteraceae bacterium]